MCLEPLKQKSVTIASSATVLHATALFLIAVWLRIGGLVSGQTKLVTELYSQGQGSMVLAELSLVQPVQSSLVGLCPSSLRLYLVPAGPHITPLTSSANLLRWCDSLPSDVVLLLCLHSLTLCCVASMCHIHIVVSTPRNPFEQSDHRMLCCASKAVGI